MTDNGKNSSNNENNDEPHESLENENPNESNSREENVQDDLTAITEGVENGRIQSIQESFIEEFLPHVQDLIREYGFTMELLGGDFVLNVESTQEEL